MATYTIERQLKGRAIGSMVFASFGALWLALSLLMAHRLGAAGGVVIGLGWLGLVGASMTLLRRVGPIVHSPAEALQEKAREKVFNIVNGAQWIGIIAVVVVLPMFHLETYISSAIVVIVGAHMFPLARVFQYRVHYVTGSALVIWALAVPLQSAGVGIPFHTAFGAGVILWVSASYTLCRAFFQLAHRPSRFALQA